jgi:hypothetical protein
MSQDSRKKILPCLEVLDSGYDVKYKQIGRAELDVISNVLSACLPLPLVLVPEVLTPKVSPPLHEHVRVYLKQGLGPLFQVLAVGPAGASGLTVG